MTLRRLLRTRRGIGALEFALIAPALMLTVLGGLEYGRLAWTQEALEAAAVAGARCMGVLAADCAAAGVYSSGNTNTYVISQAANWKLTLAAANITLNATDSCAGINKFSTVTINYTFQTALPLLVTTLANGTHLRVFACYPNTRS